MVPVYCKSDPISAIWVYPTIENQTARRSSSGCVESTEDTEFTEIKKLDTFFAEQDTAAVQVQVRRLSHWPTYSSRLQIDKTFPPGWDAEIGQMLDCYA